MPFSNEDEYRFAKSGSSLAANSNASAARSPFRSAGLPARSLQRNHALHPVRDSSTGRCLARARLRVADRSARAATAAVHGVACPTDLAAAGSTALAEASPARSLWQRTRSAPGFQMPAAPNRMQAQSIVLSRSISSKPTRAVMPPTLSDWSDHVNCEGCANSSCICVKDTLQRCHVDI
jgi:hypothetical protein